MLNPSAGHREREKELLCDINDLIKICLFGNVLTVHVYYFEGNNFFFSGRFYSFLWLWRKLQNTEKYIILFGCSSLFHSRHEVPWFFPIWLPKNLFHGPILVRYKLWAPKSIMIYYYYLILYRSCRKTHSVAGGEMKFPVLPCQKEKSKCWGRSQT